MGSSNGGSMAFPCIEFKGGTSVIALARKFLNIVELNNGSLNAVNLLLGQSQSVINRSNHLFH
jgi:hypothetical protein